DPTCPTGYTCQQGTGTCVPDAQHDTTAPDVAAGSVHVDYVPGRDNPVAQPAALAATSTAHLAFAVTEKLRATPVLTASPPLDCAVVAASDLAFEFQCNVPAADADAGDELTS